MEDIMMDHEKSGKEMNQKELKRLKKERYDLMEEIHQKQQKLDEIDYLIYQKEKRKGQGYTLREGAGNHPALSFTKNSANHLI